jgi:hypothetical protein
VLNLGEQRHVLAERQPCSLQSELLTSMGREVDADHMGNKTSMSKWEKERKEQGKRRGKNSAGWPCVDFLCYRFQLYLHQTSSQSVKQLWSMFKAAKKQHHTLFFMSRNVLHTTFIILKVSKLASEAEACHREAWVAWAWIRLC